MKPQERQLTLVAYLHHHRFGRTLEEILADIPAYGQGEGGRKKLQRDRSLLKVLGLPLRCVEHAGLTEDGNLRYLYQLDRRQVFARGLRLAPAEQETLRLLCDTLIEGPGFAYSEWVRSAREKLLGAGMSFADRKASAWPAPSLAAPGEDACLALVLHALEQGHCLRFRYQGLQRDRAAERIVHPRRLVAWRGNWLLRGWCELRGGPRSFRLQRMETVELTDLPVRTDLPDDPGPDLAFHDVGLGEGEAASVIFEAGVAPLVVRALGRAVPAVRLVEQPDGKVGAYLSIEDPAAFFRWLLGWGRQARLVGSVALQERLACWLGHAT